MMLSFIVDDAVVAQIDAAASTVEITRSEWLRQAVLERLDSARQRRSQPRSQELPVTVGWVVTLP